MSFITQKGDFSKTESFLKKVSKLRVIDLLKKYGELGVESLAQSTPVESGLTARSWEYKIESSSDGYKLVWLNSNIVDGASVAILLQYGHGTSGGTFVEGRDYINPAMRPIFEALSQELWKEVTSS